MHTSSRNFRTSLFTAVLAAATLFPAMYGQSTPTRAKAEVPFAFQVGSAHFEPGIYTVNDLAEHLISIRSLSRAALAVTRQETSLNPSPSGMMVFHKYGDKYFLAEVWTKGSAEHITIARSRAEENMRNMRTKTASIAPDSRIEVALLQGPK